MKKEALNEKRLHRGSDKPCTVRGALRAKKKIINKKIYKNLKKIFFKFFPPRPKAVGRV